MHLLSICDAPPHDFYSQLPQLVHNKFPYINPSSILCPNIGSSMDPIRLLIWKYEWEFWKQNINNVIKLSAYLLLQSTKLMPAALQEG